MNRLSAGHAPEPALSLPRRRDLPERPAGQELLVRDPERGTVHFLNAAAALIWACCDGATSPAECERRLRATFAVPDSTDLLAEIGTTVHRFRSLGLLHDDRRT